jgi:hypothetical protein
MIFARPFGAGFFSTECKVQSCGSFLRRKKQSFLGKTDNFKKIIFFCKKLYTNGKKSGKIILGILLKRS